MIPSLDTPAWICLEISLAAALVALIARFVPMWRVVRTAKKQKQEALMLNLPEDEELPFVSVIVYTITTEEALLQYLEVLMHQDYPNYEVILVNEGGHEVSASLAERLQKVYPHNLYVTFIPPESHNLSRRKLAQTVGMKAAKGEFVLTTGSNCIIPSKSWLSLMMQPFFHEPSIEIVLGYSHIEFDNLSGPGKWFNQFDATLTACQWLGAAINKYPYRGDRYNLAFRRNLFFDHKGYSQTLHLMNGDDDLFVNEISNGNNTDVMISHDAILTYDWGDSGNRILTEMKNNYRFTSKLLPKMPFLRAGLGSTMQWVTLLAAAAGALLGLPQLLHLWIAIGILILFGGAEIYVYRKAARALGSVCLFWSVPLFLLWHPIDTLLTKNYTRRKRRRHFTFD